MCSCNTLAVNWTNESVYKFKVQWLQHVQSWETTLRGTKTQQISLTGHTKASRIFSEPVLHVSLWWLIFTAFCESESPISMTRREKTCLKRRIKPHFFNLQNRNHMKQYIITLDFKKAESGALPWTLMRPWAVSRAAPGEYHTSSWGIFVLAAGHHQVSNST